MSKNIIYTINCKFSDPFTRRELMSEHLKNLDYNIDEDLSNYILYNNFGTDDQDKWSDVTMKHITDYANRIGADLKVFDEKDAFELHLPDTWFLYQRANLLKLEILKQYVESDYDNCLILDLDVLVTKKAPSIFDYYSSDKGMFWYVDGNERNRKFMRKRLKKYFDFDITFTPQSEMMKIRKRKKRLKHFQNHSNYNGGVMLCNDKDSARQINELIPETDQWEDFFKSYGAEKNEFINNIPGSEIQEQDLWVLFSHKSGVKFKPLHCKWNAGLAFEGRDLVSGQTKVGPKKRHFIHFFGGTSPSVRHFLELLQTNQGKREIQAVAGLMNKGLI